MDIVEEIKRMVDDFQKYQPLPTYVFICNPLEKINNSMLPDNVSIRRNPWVELGKGYLMEYDPYGGIFNMEDLK